jgi:hypothetical protein
MVVAEVAMRHAAKRAFEGIIVNVKTVREGMDFPFPLKGFCRFGHWREKLRSFSRIADGNIDGAESAP